VRIDCKLTSKESLRKLACWATMAPAAPGSSRPRRPRSSLIHLQNLPKETQGELVSVLGAHTIPTRFALILPRPRKDLEKLAENGHPSTKSFFYPRGRPAVEVPSLRERPEDIPGLASGTLRRRLVIRSSTRGSWNLPPMPIATLRAYGWPGNLAELNQVIRRSSPRPKRASSPPPSCRSGCTK